eukprot:CCRYP_012786-RC/>CCRYP_012786-RC protein AED:0.10 eAED:0.10 QI:1112/0.72/0.91/1/0.81/0.83/12/549/753
MAGLSPRDPDNAGAEEMKKLLSRVELLEKTVLFQRMEDPEQHKQERRPTEYDADEGIEGTLFCDPNARSTSNEDAILPVDVDDRRAKYDLYDTFELPDSTFTLLITHHFLSIPFFTGMIACALALMCLILVFINELEKGTIDNPFALPAGVTTEVRVAQFVGVLMEEEIPLGLEIMGEGIKHDESRGNGFKLRNILLSSFLRLTVGYFFLLTLFLTVIQESDVLAIFFDVLALEFVESIDDVVFALCKRGFFGHLLKQATGRSIAFVCKKSNEHDKFERSLNRFIRLIYFLNVGLMIAGLSVLMVQQTHGYYRCKSFSIQFGDETWEDAWVELDNGNMEKRLLVYSHFNGIYVDVIQSRAIARFLPVSAHHLQPLHLLYLENGTHDGKPRYVEQNKEDGHSFRSTIPAEIVYCEDAESWVFRHEKISTTLSQEDDDQNECDWLLLSPQTENYDLIEMAQEEYWSMWRGAVMKNYEVYITCNECHRSSGTNAILLFPFVFQCFCSRFTHAHLNNQTVTIMGIARITNATVMEVSTASVASKDNKTALTIMKDFADDTVDFVEIYGRPTYFARNMAGKPYGLLRYGYPDDDDEYFDVFYNSTIIDGGNSELVPHKHLDRDDFGDDDFFRVNNATSSFQELLRNYTFVLWYSGRRWYGQIFPPDHAAESFAEEEFHAFWANSFSGVGSKDNETLIISEPSTKGTPEGLSFYEMRRRNLPGSEGYGSFGVLIQLVDAEDAGFFHCVEAGGQDASGNA